MKGRYIISNETIFTIELVDKDKIKNIFKLTAKGGNYIFPGFEITKKNGEGDWSEDLKCWRSEFPTIGNLGEDSQKNVVMFISNTVEEIGISDSKIPFANYENRSKSLKIEPNIVEHVEFNVLQKVCFVFGLNFKLLTRFNEIGKQESYYLCNDKEIDIAGLPGGVKSLFSYYLLLENKTKNYSENEAERNLIVMLEEPEEGLHPEAQKKLPEIFKIFVETFKQKNVNVQFLISTHSPFIISAAAKLDNQKVYLIEDGQCINPQGSEKGGAKIQALKMLGAGLDDFIPKTIVVCEGCVDKEKTSYQHDANIYNELFGHLEDIAFYSGGGSSEIIPGGTKMKDLVNILGGTESQYFVLVESDEFDKQKNRLKSEYTIDEKMIINTGSFRELEDFLYHEKVLIFLKNYLNLDIETNSGTDKHKDMWWNKNFSKLESINIADGTNISRKKFEMYLTKIIREEFGKEELRNDPNNIYWQLHACIFSEN